MWAHRSWIPSSLLICVLVYRKVHHSLQSQQRKPVLSWYLYSIGGWSKMRAGDMSRKKANAAFALAVVALDVGGALILHALS